MVRRIEVAHANPAGADIARELFARYPTFDLRTSNGASARALRSARSELVADVDDAWLEASTRDAFHFELFRKLNPVSMMIVPLVARGRTLGAIVLMSAESGRRYTDTDLALAEDLARRAAQAA